MARIQQSIEIGVPVHTAYSLLTRFEDYPRFMQDVETVHRLDDTHLHWSTRMSNRSVEWDAEITEQQEDRCIAWHNISGPTNAGKVEVEQAGPQTARITVMIESAPEQVPGSPAGTGEVALAQRLGQDLARLKELIESGAADRNGGGAHPVRQEVDSAVRRSAGYAAGSEGWDSNEDPGMPEQPPEMDRTTLSEVALSRMADNPSDNGRFSVAEEINLDQQSDQARRVGQLPLDLDAGGQAEINPADAMAQAGQDERQPKDDKIKQSIERAVPPSE